MVQKKTHNNIRNKILIGFFVCFIVYAPLAIQAPLVNAQTAAATPAAAPPASVAAGTQAPRDAGGSDKITTTIGQFLGNLLLNIASIITWAGGMLLEYSMEKLIFGMGTLLKAGSPLGNAIDSLWKTIRDICNLAFIFGFIYIGIRTILDNESSNTKRMLAQIIIAALLINFSLFFTKIVIDFSNILAISIKNSMISGSGTISAHLGGLLGISGIFDSPSANVFPTLTAAGNIWFYFMGAIFLLVAGFVLAAGGFLLVIRFVMLVFIMIFSPILFGATIFPKTEQYAKMLWGKLISYSFFAPVYLLLLLFTMHILQAISTVLNPSKASLSTGLTNTDSFSVILLFTIAIMFLIASLQVAQKFSVIGADKALGTVKGLTGKVSSGLVAASGRATAGRLANYVSERGGLKDAAAESGVKGFAARKILKGSSTLADSSFDARKIAGVGKELGVGEGRKGGFKSAKEEVEKKEADFAKKHLSEIDDEDEFVTKRKTEMEKAQNELRLNREKHRAILRDKTASDDDRKAAKDAIDKLEKTERVATENYKQEKQRRILGSTYNADGSENRASELKKEYEKQEKALKDSWKDLENITDSAKAADARAMINVIKKQVQDAKSSYDEELRRRTMSGYADTLENASIITAWPAGRMVLQEVAAGKALRKATEKKVKKSKEDARHDELIEASKQKSA